MLNILEHYTPVQENSFMVTEDDKQFLRITETNKCELVFNLKEKGLWWKKGLVNFCKINVDLSEWRYLIFEIYNPGEELLELEIRLHTLNLVTNQQRDNYNEKGIEEVLKKTVSIIGKGWHKLSIPIEEFNHYRCFKRVHRFVERISFEIKNSGVKGEVLLKDLYLANGRDIVISCELLSRAGKIGEIIEYEVKIKNISSITKVIWIEQEKYGWEVMETEIKPDKVILKPDEQVNVKINVKISDRVPEGGIEKQKVKIYYTSASNNLEFETIEFITVCTLKNPYLIHTVEGWQRVREKIEKYEWAKKEAKKIIERAENWMPPEKEIVVICSIPIQMRKKW